MGPPVAVRAQVFVESSSAAGLAHTLLPLGNIGSGLAVFDYDGDGDDDIYVVGGREADALFENDGTGNFTNVAGPRGIRSITDGIATQSVVTGDLDNDGRREIFLGTFQRVVNGSGITNNLLLRYNETSGRYEDVSFAAGLFEPIWTIGATLFDANADGYLDLYETHYIVDPGFERDSSGTVTGFDHDCGADRLWLGDGDGTFTDAADLVGGGNVGCGLSVAASDSDQDGDPDLLVINDFGQYIEPDALYRNDLPGGGFNDDEGTATFRSRHYGMGVAVGDINEDLLPDYYITNIGRNALLLNEGDNVFARAEATYRIADEFTNFGNFTTGWGTFFADLNNDTYLDLFVANGFVGSVVDVDDVRQSDKVFRGLPEPRFFDATAQSGITDTLSSRGAVYADLDSDGRLDVLVITNDGGFAPTKLRYYRNITPDAGHYVGFRLSSDEGNRDAYGSTVVVYAGGRAFWRELSSGGSHGSQHTSLIHVGLGELTTIDSVSVRWPDGRVGWLYEPAIDQVHHIARGDLLSSVGPASTSASFTVSPNPATDVLRILGLTAPAGYQLLDLNGRTLRSGRIQGMMGDIYVGQLPGGLYLLRVGMEVRKVVVR